MPRLKILVSHLRVEEEQKSHLNIFESTFDDGKNIRPQSSSYFHDYADFNIEMMKESNQPH